MDLLEKLIWYADKKIDEAVCQELQNLALALEKEIEQYPQRKDEIERQMISMLQKVPMNEEYLIFFISALLRIFEKSQYLELLLEATLYSDNLTLQNMDFVWRNAENFLVKHPQCETAEVKHFMRLLQKHLYTELRKQVTVHPKSQENRNTKRVVVMTGIFLGMLHAPSHSALERCYMLADKLGVEVYLVASKEGALACDRIPYYKCVAANVVKEYDGVHIWPYKDKKFKFYQEPKPVNIAEGLQEVIDVVEHINPNYIVYVGTESYVADIINEFCPVLSISVTFSKLRNFHTAFAMVGRNVSQEERAGYPCEIIEVPFSFELREKQRNYTREELGIPSDAFVMAIVGLRLDYDVDDEFLECMEQLENGFLLFIGAFDKYAEKIEKYPRLKEHSLCTGMVKDVGGILECADLYVNPKRIGGGFSVIEGFHAGIPAVTLDYGDVAAAAGDTFCVKNYDEMRDVIYRYQTDEVFYRQMLAAGKEREEFMTNGGELFEKGIRQMLDSNKFY